MSYLYRIIIAINCATLASQCIDCLIVDTLRTLFVTTIVLKMVFFWFADGNPCYELMIARGCGIAINVMTSLLIFLMCRILITKIRLSDCAQYIPVDHHVSYHKIFGLLNLTLAFVHSIAHIINVNKNLSSGAKIREFSIVNNLTFNENDQSNDITMSEALFTDKLNMNGAIRGWANPTGMLLLLISIIMLIGVHPKIRQKGKYLFYLRHY